MLLVSQLVFKLSARFFELALIWKIFSYNLGFWLVLMLLNNLFSERRSLHRQELVRDNIKGIKNLEELFLLDENLDVLIKRSVEFLAENTSLTRILFFMSDPPGPPLPDVSGGGGVSEAIFTLKASAWADETFNRIRMAPDFPVVRVLSRHRKMVMVNNLSRVTEGDLDAEALEEFKTRLQIFGVNGAWPVIYKDRIRSILLFRVKNDLSRRDAHLLEEFFSLLGQKIDEEEEFEDKLSQYEKVFLMSGQLSRALKEVQDSQKNISNLEQEISSLKNRLKQSDQDIKEVSALRARLQDINRQGPPVEGNLSGLNNRMAQLEKEKKELSAQLENLLEVNRNLGASTANFSSVSRDLYEANKIIRESRNYLESLLERMSNGVIGINTEGIIVIYNRQMVLMTRLAEEEVLEKTYPSYFNQVFAEAEKISDLVKKSFVDGKSFSKIEIQLRQSDGREIPVNLSVVPLRGEEKEILGVMVVVTDLTESRKLASESRQRSQLESIQQMTVSLNHEINNPLTSVLCNIQFVLRKLKSGEGPAAAELVESLFIAEKESKRIKKILEDLRKINEPITKEYLPGVNMLDISGSIKS